MEAKKELTTDKQTLTSIIVGTNGTGKTFFAIDYAKTKAKASKKEVVIYTPHKETIVLTDDNTLIIPITKLKETHEHLQSKIIIFDDCRNYMSANIEHKTTKAINEILIKRRFANNDYIFIFHSFSQIPTFLYTFANELIIKNINESIEKLKNRIPKFDEIEKAIKQVKDFSQSNKFASIKVIL